MKTLPLLGVDADPSAFALLFEAARAAGVRLGWLDLGPEAPQDDPALEAGAERAVRLHGDRTVASVRRRGPAVLADVLRSHLLGCDAVLVRGARVGLPRLSPAPAGGWQVDGVDEAPRVLATGALLDALRRPSIVRRGWLRPSRST